MPEISCPHCGTAITTAELDAARFDAQVAVTDDPTACWEWMAARQPYGYGAFGAESRNYSAHRWQYKRWHGPIPKGMHVMHTCDNPPCVNPTHLVLGTPSENIRDKMTKGRHRFRAFHGEEHGRAKLTADQVREIRQLHADGWGYRRLAARYAMGTTTIAKIVKHTLWSHID